MSLFKKGRLQLDNLANSLPKQTFMFLGVQLSEFNLTLFYMKVFNNYVLYIKRFERWMNTTCNLTVFK